ncbi:Solute carrier organic anion transporter family member 4C1 [Toxocara canis]|uniref:Solute carrier organic anion transporter family member 4C1 n=1 Tax=Toxocara canis TaxID=6265 RepID=A0A0B2UUC5_TOXCA|nr:Solute carrier organic anion transporter family member 4C1 [Toxocara canis]
MLRYKAEEEGSASEPDDELRAETRSAPGDLAKPSPSDGPRFAPSEVEERDGNAGNLLPLITAPGASSTSARGHRTRPAGHYRNINNGFASGPPWPTPKREKPWATACGWQKKQQMQAIENEINVMANETLVGVRKWRPKWMQRFGSRNWMLLWMCWFCTVQGLLINGLVPSAITSIERRFQLSSSTIGRIMQFYDFGYVLLCIPVSYFGGRHSKPMVLAMGLLLMAFGSFIFTMPHNLSDSYTSTSGAEESSFGKCGTPGTRVFYAFAIFGPAFGFLMSSSFLRYHTDFLQPEHQFAIVNIDESDPKWVGAWWIGFQIACLLALIAVFPILSLPKVLPESLKWHRTRLHEETMQGAKKRMPECCGIPSTSKTAAICGPLLPADGDEKTTAPTITIGESMPALQNNRGPIWYHIWLDVRHIPIAIYRILSNGSYMLITLAMAVDEKTTAPTITIGESMPALQNNRGPIWYHIWLDVRHIPIAIYRILSNGSYMLITLAMAVDGLIVTGASTFMSKYLERQFSVAPSKANMLIGCIMVPMAGMGTMFSGFVVQRFRLSCVKTLKFCIALLMCSLLLSPMYLIYCDHDQLAGIETHYELDNLRSSLVFFLPQNQPKYNGVRKLRIRCEADKWRTVDYAERSFALGIQWILVRVIGTIPAPVLFGWMFDVSCIRQHLDPCSGQQGSCMLYQNKLLADLFLAFSVVGQTIAMVFLICTLIFFSTQMRDDPLPTAAVVAVRDSEDADVNMESVACVVEDQQQPQ